MLLLLIWKTNFKIMSNKKRLAILSLFIFVLFGLDLKISWAESYDIYVDKDYDSDNSDGSSKKPYKKISEAIEEASDGDVIYIKNGTYEENIVLEEGIKLIGEEKSKTIIRGTNATVILAKGDNDLKNLTVSGGRYGVVFEKKGSLKNCLMKNSLRVAVTLNANSGNVDILNSDFKENGKGIYAQKESSFNITGNNFINNTEEGVDIREKTSGTISDNYIADSGEGGLEIILGSSNVSIKNNIIKKNKASGIALQFYSIANKTGKILIQGNTLSHNGNNGITCKNPSGGKPSSTYFSDSVELKENIIENNKLGSLNSFCFMKIAVPEETVDLEIKNPKENPKEDLEEKTALENSETLQNLEEEINLEITLRSLTVQKQSLYETIANDFKLLESESKTKIIFFGPNYEHIGIVKKDIDNLSEIKNQFDEIGQKFENIKSTANKMRTDNEISEINNEISSKNSEILRREKKFSLFGWAIRFFANK